jgi:hypothetical protein
MFLTRSVFAAKACVVERHLACPFKVVFEGEYFRKAIPGLDRPPNPRELATTRRCAEVPPILCHPEKVAP